VARGRDVDVQSARVDAAREPGGERTDFGDSARP
jgi:hypothetical protein